MRSNQKSRSGDMDINPNPADLTNSVKPQELHNSNNTYSTVSEFSERFSIGYRVTLSLIENGSLEAHRIGGEYRISEEQIENFMLDTLTKRTEKSNVQDDPVA
ncbi:MAG: excisionase family DNA-binding protein [FCB group bacterium]|nr:excisionase family DNA-binding protein [FCB group bacterium]MBL7028974.1 excisionase family DNA-binding protein [Candidatus Neomarinimicrobiota bacterium]MBL7121994.1 excisionase family DNA-binding protein [Candidatus Neomarinimicrobiota bacterium]